MTTLDEGAAPSALGHLTICDLSGQLAGAGATRFLAAFGARVIRVEDPVRKGDGTSCVAHRRTSTIGAA